MNTFKIEITSNSTASLYINDKFIISCDLIRMTNIVSLTIRDGDTITYDNHSPYTYDQFIRDELKTQLFYACGEHDATLKLIDAALGKTEAK